MEDGNGGLVTEIPGHGLTGIPGALKQPSDVPLQMVHFYDGDPGAGGTLIGIETAWFKPRTTTKISIPYHAPSDGIHHIWAVINEGKPYRVERLTAAIVVGNALPDPNNSDGDVPPNDKAGNDADKN